MLFRLKKPHRPYILFLPCIFYPLNINPQPKQALKGLRQSLKSPRQALKGLRRALKSPKQTLKGPRQTLRGPPKNLKRPKQILKNS